MKERPEMRQDRENDPVSRAILNSKQAAFLIPLKSILKIKPWGKV